MKRTNQVEASGQLVVKEFTEAEKRRQVYGIHCKGAVGGTAKERPSGRRQW